MSSNGFIGSTPSPAVDGRVVLHDVGGEANLAGDHTAQKVFGALDAAKDVLGALRVANNALAADPTLPDEARAVELATFGKRRFPNATTALDDSRDAIRRERTDHERAIARSYQPPAETAGLASEVRTRLAAMPDPEARAKLISAAIRDGDRTVAGAVLHAPSWLSGITDAQRDNYRSQWAQLHERDRLDRLEVLRRLEARLDAAGSVLMDTFHKVTAAAKVASEAKAAREAALK